MTESLQVQCLCDVAFLDLPVLRWRSTKAGRVRAQHALSERMYYLYTEDGRFVMGIHESALDTLLEPVDAAS